MTVRPPGPIAYLTGTYPRATDTFIEREIAGLRALGFKVETCTIRQTDPAHHVGPEQTSAAATTFPVLRTTLHPWRAVKAHATLIAQRPRRWVRALGLAWRLRPAGLRAILWQIAYFLEAGVLAHHLRTRQVVHLHNHFSDACCTVAVLTSELTGIPFSFTMHGPGVFFDARRWRIDEKIARAAFVACISHFCRSQAMYLSDQAHWHKLKIVHCGVSPNRYRSVPSARSEPDTPSGKAVLFVGRLDHVKGVPLLFEAMMRLRAKHPEATLTLVGDGPIRADLESMAQSAGLRAAFLGFQSQSAVAAVLARHDMLVLASFAEGVPVVLMEAMAAGLPTIASHVAGIPELVRDGETGFLTPPGDVDALTRCLDRLLSDPALCRTMGQAGRAVVEADFSVQSESRWLATILEGRAGHRLRPETTA